MPSFVSREAKGRSPPCPSPKPLVIPKDSLPDTIPSHVVHLSPNARLHSILEWAPVQEAGCSTPNGPASIEKVVGHLESGPLDLLQYRISDYTNDTYIRHLHHLTGLRALGKFKHLGLIDVDAAHLELVLGCGFPVTNYQISCSILDQRLVHSRAVTTCIEHQIGILAENALLGGFLSEQWLGRSRPTEQDMATFGRSAQTSLRCIEAAGGWIKFQNLLRVLDTIAQRHCVSISAVAIRHTLDVPCVDGLVVDTECSADYETALSFALVANERAQIEAVQRTLAEVPRRLDQRDLPLHNLVCGNGIYGWRGRLGPATRQPTEDYPRWEYSSGSKWEPIAGYCRAVRTGNRIRVSGTTANSPLDSLPALGGSSARSQLVAILDIIERSLIGLGASMQDLTHTRIMVVDPRYCDEVSEVHGDRFRDVGVLPANTLVTTGLMEKQYLVEVEAEAEVVV